MILSNVCIQKALDDGRLIITPEPTPRMPSPGAEECPYQTTAVDLRLGTEFSWMKEGLALSLNLRHGGLAKTLADNSHHRQYPEDEAFTLNPTKFVLAKTLERIELPIRNNPPWLAARVEGRSSYARCGLLIHFTAPTIHAGFEGHITLEIMNFGLYPITLYPYTPICQLILEEVSSQPTRNDSQFQGQAAAVGTTEAVQPD